MLFITDKRIVEGLCFVEKINKDIDGFYDDFFGALSVSLTVAEEVSGSLALTAMKWFLMELSPSNSSRTPISINMYQYVNFSIIFFKFAK